jgi:hypothetical protein
MLPKIAVPSFSLSRMTSVKALLMSLAMWAVLLAGSACTFYKDVPARSMAEATGGEGLERVFWKNVQSANWIEVERALASNYAGITPTETLDRSATIAQYRNWQLKDYAIGDLQTELNGPTIVVTYTVTLNGTLANGTSSPKPLSSEPQHMMTVWQQQKKGWVAIAHSSSQQSSSQQ